MTTINDHLPPSLTGLVIYTEMPDTTRGFLEYVGFRALDVPLEPPTRCMFVSDRMRLELRHRPRVEPRPLGFLVHEPLQTVVDRLSRHGYYVLSQVTQADSDTLRALIAGPDGRVVTLTSRVNPPKLVPRPSPTVTGLQIKAVFPETAAAYFKTLGFEILPASESTANVMTAWSGPLGIEIAPTTGRNSLPMIEIGVYEPLPAVVERLALMGYAVDGHMMQTADGMFVKVNWLGVALLTIVQL